MVVCDVCVDRCAIRRINRESGNSVPSTSNPQVQTQLPAVVNHATISGRSVPANNSTAARRSHHATISGRSVPANNSTARR
eukprot:scaffold15114_cov45-Phaeocystis_antarctica.AAC.1